MEVLEMRQLLSLPVGSTVQPAASPIFDGVTYVVSTKGLDSANGSSSTPFRTVNRALSVAQPGDVILVKNGTYHERIVPTRSGTAERPITVRGQSKARVIFDGTGLSEVILTNDQSHITVQNITVRRCANGPFNDSAAVTINNSWTLEDMVVEKVDGTGICVNGDNVTLKRVISQDNGVAGIGGTYADAVFLNDCVVRRNNRGLPNPVWKNDPHAYQINGRWYMDPDYEAGGGKWWACSHITFDGMRASGNTGPGIWFDWDSSDVNILNSIIYENRGLPGKQNAYQGDGIRVELQKDGPWEIAGNLIRGNSGAGIVLIHDRNVVIRGNTLVNDNILFRDWGHDGEYTIRDITITGNLLKSAGIETWEGDWTATSGEDRRIIIDGNTYNGARRVLMSWGGTDYTSIDTIRSSLGFEASGRRGR